MDKHISTTRTTSKLISRGLAVELKALEQNASRRSVEAFTNKKRDAVGFESFKAIARIFRERESNKAPARTAKTLMDPGAELNLIQASLVNTLGRDTRLKIHAREACNIELLNNGKLIGIVQEAVYLSFALEGVDGSHQIYHEWFHVWDKLHEDIILGSQFCREQGYTSFHTRLLPWSDELSSKRPKRSVEHIAADIPERDETSPWEVDEQEHSPGEHTASSRKRERVETLCEKIDNHAAKFADVPLKETVKTGGRRVPSRHVFTPNLTQKEGFNMSRSNYAPVDYNAVQCKQIGKFLASRVITKTTELSKAMQELKASDVVLTSDEQETLRDAARMCAQEAATFFDSNPSHLDKLSARQGTKHKHFMSDELDEAEQAPRAFANGQCVILQNLVTHSELNDKAARVVAYDVVTKLYAISIAKPHGYWWATENKLRSIDPKPTKDDYRACGIDPSTGQPTLDPLAKPVHRQYGKEYSPALTARITVLLEKYKHVFGKDITVPCKFRPMRIELVPNANLPSNPHYWKNSPQQRAEVRTQLQSFMDMNIVSPSTTSVVSNVLLVKRPGMPGKFRFTIDFRKLNDATVSTPWQMPDVESQLQRLAHNCIFGCIDLSSYYHQIELEKGSRYLTGFVTEDGVFEYSRVAMGLKNACAWAQSQLQNAIDADPILSKYGLRNYFDDLPLAANTEDDFIEQLTAVLELGVKFNLKFNLEKSIFGMDSITHVGFVVRAEGIEVDPQRIDSLREVEAPKSIKGVQSVLGVWNYIRNFIPNFSTRALPLTNMVGKGQGKAKTKPFIWTDECQAAFDDLKAATLDTRLLANINYNLPIFIRCDSSQYGAGAVLFQFDEQGLERPIAYASRKYTLAERNYCTFQQEAAAVVWSLEKFANLHQGNHVTVQSDHKNLSWISKSAMPQLTRWRLRLQDFDFALEYYEGAKNIVADGLSRMRVDDKDIDISIRDFLPEHAAQQSYLQGNAPMRQLNQIAATLPARCMRLYSHTSERNRPVTRAEQVWEGTSSDLPEPYVDPDEQLWEAPAEEREHDELYESQSYTNPTNVRDFMPIGAAAAAPPAIPHLEDTPRQVFDGVHNATVGHNGVLVTLNRVLRQNKGWASRKDMLEQIDQFISGCTVCQKFRKRHNRRTDERFVIEGNPFSELSVDILKLPKRDCNNNLYVVVIVDSFSRWVSLEAVQNKSALAAARAILNTIGDFGVPLTIRSDGGKEFISDILAGIEHILGVKHHKIMAYHHEGNSLAEKANRSVLENLRNLIFDKRFIINGEHQWSDLLPLVQRIMNASFNSSVGCSPSSLVFGNNIDLDRCLMTPQPVRLQDVDVTDYVQVLSYNQNVLLDAAGKVLHETHKKNLAKWSDGHPRDSELRASLRSMASDDELPVWVLARVRDDAPLEKWKPRWAGPFRLLDFKDSSESVLRLYDTTTNKVIEAHINDVELWNASFESSTEGMQRIAEFDNWSYPMDAILGMALSPESDDDETVSLPLDQPRTVANKHKYVFSVKWQGYAEPSWEPYTSVKDTTLFQLFKNSYSVLKL